MAQLNIFSFNRGNPVPCEDGQSRFHQAVPVGDAISFGGFLTSRLIAMPS